MVGGKLDIVSLPVFLSFLKLILLRGSIPSKTQETNIHCTCFFSILRNYMQMTLRSINHIGFHFTKG